MARSNYESGGDPKRRRRQDRTKQRIEKAKNQGLGVIHAGSTYPIELFLELTGLKESWLDTLKALGLQTLQFGAREFVTGDEWNRLIEKWISSEPHQVAAARAASERLKEKFGDLNNPDDPKQRAWLKHSEAQLNRKTT